MGVTDRSTIWKPRLKTFTGNYACVYVRTYNINKNLPSHKIVFQFFYKIFR